METLKRDESTHVRRLTGATQSPGVRLREKIQQRRLSQRGKADGEVADAVREAPLIVIPRNQLQDAAFALWNSHRLPRGEDRAVRVVDHVTGNERLVRVLQNSFHFRGSGGLLEQFVDRSHLYLLLQRDGQIDHAAVHDR